MRQPSVYTYRFELPVARETLFSLFSEPRYLDLLTPAWFRLHPIGAIPEPLGEGSEISYRLRWRGLPFRWTSRLTDWRHGEFFAYEQERGPYLYFRHEHFFTLVEGGTAVTDRVLFRTPGGLLGDRWVARPDLRRIFATRQRRALPLLRALAVGEPVSPRADSGLETRLQPTAPGPSA